MCQKRTFAFDMVHTNRVVFEPTLLSNLIERFGLVIHIAFALEVVAYPAVNFRLDRDLADDKECYTTSFRMLCDSNVA
jgi:hypothetical protein